MLNFSKTSPTLIAYLTCGDPSLAVTRSIALAAIDAGADVLELGVPFSDPVADGPVIQRASQRALARGTSLADVLQLAAELHRALPQAGLIIFSYFNPILCFGLKKFSIAAKSAGVDGALVTDLTVEEAQRAQYLALMREQKLATVFLAAPTSPDARLRQIARASRGFIYALSRTGITGMQSHLAEDAAKLVKRLRKFSKLPLVVGFGISNAEQFRAAAKFADGIAVGSAIVNLIESVPPEEAPDAVAAFIRSLKSENKTKRASVR